MVVVELEWGVTLLVLVLVIVVCGVCERWFALDIRAGPPLKRDIRDYRPLHDLASNATRSALQQKMAWSLCVLLGLVTANPVCALFPALVFSNRSHLPIPDK